MTFYSILMHPEDMSEGCLLVWLDRVRHLATDPVVMRSSPVTGHIR